MTAYEAYLESDQATDDARAWLNGLDDDTAFDLYEQHGPITDRFEAWCQAGAEAAAERHRADPLEVRQTAAGEIVVIRGADLAHLAADADPTPPHGIDRPPACQTVT